MYMFIQVNTVLYILWAQTIAAKLYGTIVCGFLCVAGNGFMILTLIFFKCWYQGYLERKLAIIERQIKVAWFKDDIFSKKNNSTSMINNNFFIYCIKSLFKKIDKFKKNLITIFILLSQ